MPNRDGLPQPGEEVQFADGTTNTIKRYMRSRFLDADPVGQDAPKGHVVEMAKPFRHEYVTVVAFKETGFWAPVGEAVELSPDQQHEERFEEPTLADVLYDGTPNDKAMFRKLLTPLVLRIFVIGLITGAVMGLALGSALWR